MDKIFIRLFGSKRVHGFDIKKDFPKGTSVVPKKDCNIVFGIIMICPLCGVKNSDNWPVTVEGIVKEGGCQVAGKIDGGN